jgi:hypothetical protein
MAIYKYSNYLKATKHASFDLPLQPGAFVPCAGIYRCVGCGTEIALEGIGIFPDRGHHKHSPSQGTIQWQLVVGAVSDLPAPYLHGAA